MRAIRFHDYSGIDGLRDEAAPVPVAGRGQILLRVHAAAVNPFDWYAIEGYVSQYVTFTLPAVLGRDVSGVVEAVGESVDGFAVDDAVFGQTDPAGHGSFAEYTVIDAFRAAQKPENLSHVQAASLPNVILAAWDGLFSATSGLALQPGQTVLVNGAAGGIGSIAVQLAQWRGAHVNGSASATNIGFLRELGVAQALDYTVAGWLDRVGPVDAVLDTADGQSAAALCARIKPGGRYAGLRGALDAAFVASKRAAGINCVVVNGPDSIGMFSEMAALVASGAIKPVVSAVYPLDDIKTALRRVREGHVRGKIVISIAE